MTQAIRVTVAYERGSSITDWRWGPQEIRVSEIAAVGRSSLTGVNSTIILRCGTEFYCRQRRSAISKVLRACGWKSIRVPLEEGQVDDSGDDESTDDLPMT